MPEAYDTITPFAYRSDNLVTVVVSLVPADAVRRIDQPDPGNCPS
jgi:hypothetical protein